MCGCDRSYSSWQGCNSLWSIRLAEDLQGFLLRATTLYLLLLLCLIVACYQVIAFTLLLMTVIEAEKISRPKLIILGIHQVWQATGLLFLWHLRLLTTFVYDISVRGLQLPRRVVIFPWLVLEVWQARAPLELREDFRLEGILDCQRLLNSFPSWWERPFFGNFTLLAQNENALAHLLDVALDRRLPNRLLRGEENLVD